MSIRVLTWNLQGSAGPDLSGVAAVIGDALPDVVLLQEVQRRQAQALAAHLGWSCTWRFKHWPIVVPAEGLAVLAPTPPAQVQTISLARFYAFWSWKRRIAIGALLVTADGDLEVADVHLGADIPESERAHQAALTAGLVATPVGLVAGDLNTSPGSPTLEVFAADGLRDAWVEVNAADPGATNWAPGPRDGAPTQRLDYVLVGDGLRVVAAELPAPSAADFGRYGALSDHLPLTVTVEIDPA